MSRSFGDWLSDQIGMLPLHLTGITTIAAVIEAGSDVLTGKVPKTKDVVSALGIIDVADHTNAISDAIAGIAVDEALDRLEDDN